MLGKDSAMEHLNSLLNFFFHLGLWPMSVIPTLSRLRQEDYLKASLGSIARYRWSGLQYESLPHTKNISTNSSSPVIGASGKQT